jgi:hypothetical protein
VAWGTGAAAFWELLALLGATVLPLLRAGALPLPCEID